MSRDLKDIRTSLAVGFDGEALPETFARYRGRLHRAIPPSSEFPYEDGQFDIVFLAAGSVSEKLVREAHRVLKPNGWLCFIVPEKTKRQEGFVLPDVYSIVRNGFNIIELARTPWWRVLIGGARTLSIRAQKKTWRVLTNTFRPYL